MFSTKHAKHAKPALHPTRSTLSAGLTAVLLPLCLASPALANSLPDGSQPGATSTATGSASPAPSSASTVQPDAEPTKADTTVRISGPAGTVAPGSHALGVRLLADGKPVKNGYVRLEKWTSRGWAYAGRLLTGADGLGSGRFGFSSTTKLRAVYQGSASRTAGKTAPITVTVAKAASFRQRAVKVASQQQGKPYRYGSTGPSSFDCSGLMVYVFKSVGKNLPRTSQQQLNGTQRISKSQMRPGDLVFTQHNGRVGHVGVFAGNNKFWVAPKSGDVVKLQTFYTSNFLVGRVA